ncbi:MAG: alpha/beta hydrolase [bacterium]
MNLKKIKKTKYISLFLSLIFWFQIFQPALGFHNIETKLIYYPINKNMSEIRLQLKTDLQDTYFYSMDGIKLNAWYIKARDNKPTIIYCHGQGENISLWQSIAQFLADNGYGVFMLDYRGHGKSQGSPSETGLYIDLESSIDYLKKYEYIPQDNIVLWGRSLGGAVVADISSRNEFRGVILESTFTNIRDVAIHLTNNGILEGKYGFWEGISTKFVKYMPFTQKFETEKKIYKIKSPLLIAHSVNDATVPVKMSLKLAELNPSVKLFISKNGSHHESEWIKAKVLEFLESI